MQYPDEFKNDQIGNCVQPTLSGKKTQVGRSSTLILDSIITFSLVRAAWRAADSLASRSLFHCDLN